MRVLILSIMAIGLMAGAGRKLPPEFEPIAQLALSAPPAFAANGLLRLVESGKIVDLETRIDMAGQAFDLASHSPFAVRMRALAGTPADTAQGSLAKAYALDLDTVSLQSRAVVAMLPVDPLRARQMFGAMVKPQLPALACEDSLAYDMEAYYRTLAAVAQGGFTAKERAKEDHVAFLLEYVAQVHAPSQAAPMASAIKAAGLTPQQQETVAARLSGQLEPGQAGAHCAEGSAKTTPYWQSNAAGRLMAAARALRFGAGAAKVLSDAERSSPEWLAQLADFEKELASWSAGEQPEMDFYQQKCLVFEALVELIPRGPERDRALQAFIEFLGASNLQAQHPVEWFAPAVSMLERVRNTNNGEPAKLLAAFEASGNPALALYAALERTFDRGLPPWVSGG